MQEDYKQRSELDFSESAVDPWEKERRRRVRLFIYVGASVSFYYAVRSYFNGAAFTPLVHFTTLVSLGVAWVLEHRAPEKIWGQAAMIVAIHNMVFFSSIFDGMVSALGLWCVGLLPMAASCLMSYRATMVTAGFAALDLAIIALLDIYTPVAREITPGPADTVLLLIVNIGLFGLFSYLSLVDAFVKIRFMKAQRVVLNKSNEESARAYESKRRFLAKMSHEIRTPMNGLLGSTQELKALDLEPDVVHALLRAEHNAENLLVALNLSLASSKFEHSRNRIKSEALNLERCMRQVQDFFRHHSRKPKIDVKIQSDEEGIWCHADGNRVRQVLSNLVSELIHPTTPVELQLNAHIETHDQDPQEWVFIEIVRSSDRAYDARIEAWDSLSAPLPLHSALNDGHASLSRAVAEQLIQDMDGAPLVLHDDSGSTILGFRFPYVAVEPRNRLSAGCAAQNEAAREARVLVVDDNPINLKLATIQLRKLGCAVTTAVDGKIAVDLAKRNKFDLIFMDVRMPVMGGLEASRRICSESALNAYTPILALTANAYESDKQDCLAAGMVEHIAKPVRPGELERALDRYFFSRDLQRTRERDAG